jgi:quercetin dioxygenase-like cupin family protein
VAAQLVDRALPTTERRGGGGEAGGQPKGVEETVGVEAEEEPAINLHGVEEWPGPEPEPREVERLNPQPRQGRVRRAAGRERGPERPHPGDRGGGGSRGGRSQELPSGEVFRHVSSWSQHLTHLPLGFELLYQGHRKEQGMNRCEVVLMGAIALAPLLLAGTNPPSLDPAVVNAGREHVQLENNHVRVIEGVLQPGDKERMHSHPAFVTYVISGSKIRNHFADGKVVEAELKTGDVLYREPQTHWVENIGMTTLHFLLVELKNPG